PVILSGIEDFVTRPDLLERTLLICHPPIDEAKRRPESELLTEFEAAIPKLLGALFDYVAGGLRELPAVCVPGLPRMADFALFAVACEVARSGSGDEFLRADREYQAGANEQVLDEPLVAIPVRPPIAHPDEWRDTAKAPRAALDARETEG